MVILAIIKTVILLANLLVQIPHSEHAFNDVPRLNTKFSFNITIIPKETAASDIEALKAISYLFEPLYKSYARTLVSGSEFFCLETLWTKESNWNPFAHNKRSGAYGIPQSLPGDKMASKGDDWRINYKTQINWGLDYINKRYKSSCNALAHHELKGWY